MSNKEQARKGANIFVQCNSVRKELMCLNLEPRFDASTYLVELHT